MKNIISVWLQPDPKLKLEIFKIIKSFSKKYKVYDDLNSYKGPHISILSIDGNKQNLKEISEKIKDMSREIKPFRLDINGISYFMKADNKGKRNYVIYLKVKRNKQLTALKNKIAREFPKESLRHKDRKFIPHITITHGELDKESFYKALKENRNLNFVRNFIVNGVMVSKRNSNDKPTIRQIIIRK
jgi:2'-5' RNA ligase